MAMFPDKSFLSVIAFYLGEKDLKKTCFPFHTNLRGYLEYVLLRGFSPVFFPPDSEVCPQSSRELSVCGNHCVGYKDFRYRDDIQCHLIALVSNTVSDTQKTHKEYRHIYICVYICVCVYIYIYGCIFFFLIFFFF